MMFPRRLSFSADNLVFTAVPALHTSTQQRGHFRSQPFTTPVLNASVAIRFDQTPQNATQSYTTTSNRKSAAHPSDPWHQLLPGDPGTGWSQNDDCTNVNPVDRS